MKDFIEDVKGVIGFIIIFGIVFFLIDACENKMDSNNNDGILEFCGGVLYTDDYNENNKIDWKRLSKNIDEVCEDYYENIEEGD